MFQTKEHDSVTEEELASAVSALGSAALFFASGAVGDEQMSPRDVASILAGMMKSFSEWPRHEDGTLCKPSEVNENASEEAKEATAKLMEAIGMGVGSGGYLH